jgi:hypothetical protein
MRQFTKQNVHPDQSRERDQQQNTERRRRQRVRRRCGCLHHGVLGPRSSRRQMRAALYSRKAFTDGPLRPGQAQCQEWELHWTIGEMPSGPAYTTSPRLSLLNTRKMPTARCKPQLDRDAQALCSHHSPRCPPPPLLRSSLPGLAHRTAVLVRWYTRVLNSAGTSPPPRRKSRFLKTRRMSRPRTMRYNIRKLCP